MSRRAIKLYCHPHSDQSHSVELMLSLLGLEAEVISVSRAQGMYAVSDANPIGTFGMTPAIDDYGSVVADSNAILIYLGAKYGGGEWLPSEQVALGNVIRWLSLATGEARNRPAPRTVGTSSNCEHEDVDPFSRSKDFLQEMDRQLSTQHFLAGNKPTIADVSAYVYVSHAQNGNLSLSPFPQVRRWLESVESLPRFVRFSTHREGLRKRE